MRTHILAASVLALVSLCGLLAPMLARYGYDEQMREYPGAPASRRFPMGTDEIGRDRFSRLMYATRTSVLLAPAAALLSVTLALLLAIPAASPIAGVRALLGGLITVSLSLPWIFLFIILRSALPLNTGPVVSVVLTFALMGVAGWAWPARVLAASIREFRDSGWILQARAAGMRPWRIAAIHGWPHLRTVALAQFRVLVPAYILSEASLGLLGLGVPDPLPSWGNMLQELQHPDLVRANPWMLAPLGLLVVVMICLENLGTTEEALR